jgi:hypothetical protein
MLVSKKVIFSRAQRFQDPRFSIRKKFTADPDPVGKKVSDPRSATLSFTKESYLPLSEYRKNSEIVDLKGQLHEIFDQRFFSSNNPPQGPDSRPKAVSHMASYSPRKSILF